MSLWEDGGACEKLSWLGGSCKCNRKSVCSGVPSALSVRSGGISLHTDCEILFTDFWPNFQVEKVVSTLKIQEEVLLNHNESLGLDG
jgi:hypothetical protein